MPRNDANTPFVLTLDNSDSAIRVGLANVRHYLESCDVEDDLCGPVEVVLAEALNNIVEHAFGPGMLGTIRLEIMPGIDSVICEIHDNGAPLPDNALPPGIPPAVDVPRAELPEGGFGWYIIRRLTTDLHYARLDNENRLSFKVRGERF
ncbi:ATP-binding protein [Roseovarius pelagicus]|uniref:ATP-binding protein n=1 Tax=Roseovarius pelagicus TaxID=2980108 RepID=A0ABY6D8J4_9RHOB|nr:ATP-binding protein [Roseovarius pelagicus]UXX82454.1 ATP-binding protein [Roseovarius pelagicus]